MEFLRVGNKIINEKKIMRVIDKILQMREDGLSQSQVAREINVDRSFISRLESIGEVRKGDKIALVGFPVENKQELTNLGQKYGLDYIYLLTEKERWNFIEESSGLEIFNQVIELIVKLKEFDLIIFIGSDMRLDLIEKLMDGEIIGIKIGESPINENKYVDTDKIEKIFAALS
ncbi:MAG: transcriptional regulator [bacterium]